MTLMFSALPPGGGGWSVDAYSACAAATGLPWASICDGGRVLDVVEQHEREHGEEDQDRRGADGPADLQLRVAVDLRRHAALAGAVLDHRVDQQALDPDEDHQADRARSGCRASGCRRRSASRRSPAGTSPRTRRARASAPRGARPAGPLPAREGDAGSWTGLQPRRRQYMDGRPGAAGHRPSNVGGPLLQERQHALLEVAGRRGRCWIDGLELELGVHAREQPVR